MNKDKLKKLTNTDFFYVVLIIIIGLLVFYKATGYGLVWDDEGHLKNVELAQNFTIDNFKKILVSNYMIVPTIIWSSFYKILNGNEVSYYFHLLNIIIHIINTLILFLLLASYSNNKFYSFLGVLIFLIHPLQVETVVWISGFRSLISLFFGLTMCFFISNLKMNLLVENILLILLFAFSLLSKPSGIIFLPIIIFIYSFVLKKKVIRLFPFIMYSIIFSYLFIFKIMNFTENASTISYSNIFERMAIVSDSLIFYLSKFLFPYKIEGCYFRTTSFVLEKPFIYFHLVTFFILFILLYKFIIRSNKKYLYTLLLFLISILPTSGIVSFVFQEWSTVANRYFYFPMIAISIFVSFILVKLKYLKYIILLFLFSYSIYSNVFIMPIWKNNRVFWESNLKNHSQKDYVLYNLGVENYRMDKYDESIQYFKQTLIQSPSFYEASYALALSYSKIGNDQKALKILEQIKEMADTKLLTKILISEYFIYFNQEKYEEALKVLNSSIKKFPYDYRFHYYLGNINSILGNYFSAINNYYDVLLLNKTHKSSQKNIVVLIQNMFY